MQKFLCTLTSKKEYCYEKEKNDGVIDNSRGYMLTEEQGDNDRVP